MDNKIILNVSPKNGIRKEFQNLEIEVYKWVLNEKKKHKKLPSRKVIQKYALDVYKKAGHEEFKASLGWYRRWEKRYDLKGRSKTSLINKIDDIKNPSSNKQGENLTLNVCSCAHDTQKDNLPDELIDTNKCSNTESNINESFYSQTLDNFSLETDKLMSNIEMINSPSEFFNFSDSFDKSMDSVDFYSESMKTTSDTDSSCMKNFMRELIDDFGKYFSETDKCHNKNSMNAVKLSKKSCKYDKDFKDRIIQYISDHRIVEAAAKFNVHPNTISNWMKENEFLNQLTEIICKGPEEKMLTNEIELKEKQFIEWLRENEKNNIIVSKLQVKKKIQDLLVPDCISLKLHWFAKYCDRYINGKQANKAIKIRYSYQFQKLMVNYAKKTSQLKTASVFNVARKQLFNWVKNVQTKDFVNKNQADENLLQWYESQKLKPLGSMIRNTGKKILNNEGIEVNCSYNWYYKWCAKHGISVKRNCDEEVVKWILSTYDENVHVSHRDVQKKALEIYRRNNEGSFKASPGWLLRFCKRYMNLLRRIPPLTAVLPPLCEKSIKIFLQTVLHVLTKYNIKRESFGVMDEILLNVKPSGIINGKDQKRPLLRSCGSNNIQGTVILTCLSNGVVLPPVLVLKDKNIDNVPSDYFVLYQSNGVVDNSVVLFWLKNIWFRYVEQPNLLLLDCFSPHSSDEVRQKFLNNSYFEIIPGGCSSKLNPLTQVVAPQFQESIDKNCTKWFDTNSYAWQIGDTSSSLSSEDIIDWVGKAYESINTNSTKELVRNVFEQMKLITIEAASQ